MLGLQYLKPAVHGEVTLPESSEQSTLLLPRILTRRRMLVVGAILTLMAGVVGATATYSMNLRLAHALGHWYDEQGHLWCGRP